MSIDSINTSLYTPTISGLGSGSQTGGEASGSKTAKSGSRSSLGGYAFSSQNSQSSLVSQVLAELGLDSGDQISFQAIADYRNRLSKSFETQVKSDLKKLGVDEDVNFQLVSGKDGGIQVVTQHKDKAVIEKYFEDNPDMVKQFEKIQSLTNVDEARKAQKYDPKAVRQRIQIESMTAWFASSGQNVNAIMDFSGGTSALLAGLNRTV